VQEQRRRSAAIGRKLRMLRAQDLIRKRSRSHRYEASRKGRLILNALRSAHHLTVQPISAIAA
jgi:predicted transcriptional regulator